MFQGKFIKNRKTFFFKDNALQFDSIFPWNVATVV